MPNVQPIFRSDYQAFPFQLETVVLQFSLDATVTTVAADLLFGACAAQDLFLHGEDLRLVRLAIDDQEVAPANYRVDERGLTISGFTGGRVQTIVEIAPSENTELSGLYQSGPLLCTQCEAEGFRRITYFPDRPDVMTVFTTTLVADPARYPTLLANGNRQSSQQLDDGRLAVTWHDPHPKPCYLFALVAGKLHCHAGTFTTSEGRTVALEILVEERNKHLCEHALWSLAESMRWDEQRYGRCYDLDVYMIVAVDDFNMGAMENKGLNIFNAKYVLASPATATDDDYEHVAAVIAHEYFHNWTGNRVTCRDWFQLTLKEGLTVFRDQQFTADHTSQAVKRIDDVRMLRSHQFPEDAGPQRHPIRPEQYIVMDNFYTLTVYEKGAEVIRMYHTLLGDAGFRRGMDLYFERHDGSAVTCDDFRAAMADANANKVNLFDPGFAQFEWWYRQSGTPLVRVRTEWDAKTQQVTLFMQQEGPITVGLDQYQVMVIPLKLAFITASGKPCDSVLIEPTQGASQHEHLCVLNQSEQTFVFQLALDGMPVVSFLRNFSAPVRVELQQSSEALLTLAAHDTDPFNRWQAGQSLAMQALQACIAGAPVSQEAAVVAKVWSSVLADSSLDPSLQARAIQLPTMTELLQSQRVMEFDRTQQALRDVRAFLRDALRGQLRETYDRNVAAANGAANARAVGQRRLAMTCLGHLGCNADPEGIGLAHDLFAAQRNMTEVQAALSVLASAGEQAIAPLNAFHKKWRHDPLVLDKWFMVQAAADTDDAVERVSSLCEHADFTLATPNRVRSVLGVFANGNLAHFHRADGSGYRLLGTYLRQLCTKNPQLAARLTGAFNQWRRCDPHRAALQQEQLQALRAVPGCAADVLEVIDRALGVGAAAAAEV